MTIPEAMQEILEAAFADAKVYRLPVYTQADDDKDKSKESIDIDATEAVPVHENIPCLVTQQIQATLKIDPANTDAVKRALAWDTMREALATADLQAAIEAKTGTTIKHLALASIVEEIEDDMIHHTIGHQAIHFLTTD